MHELKQLSEHLWVFEDTCNVYVIKDGDSALLIDAGEGAVSYKLSEIGCRQIEWILHTHHHRDQCWGDSQLMANGTQIAVPQYEKHLFDKAEVFWQSRRVFDNYNDRNTFFSIGQNIPVSETLRDYETFEWRGYEFYILPAKGHTLGSISLLVAIDGHLIAFVGDLMTKGGYLYQLHAMEYTYGDMIGVIFTLQSIQALRDCLNGEIVAGRSWKDKTFVKAPLFLPSHGEPIEHPLEDIDHLESRLLDLVALGRGLRISNDKLSNPEITYLPNPKFVPLSPHLLWGGSWTCSQFYVILSESGKAMFIDYGHAFTPNMHIGADHDGFESMRFIEHHLKELREDYGITTIDLAVPTHIHDDHTCGIPHLQKYYGTKCFALDEVAQVLENPAAWASTPCTYHEPIRIDRILRDNERFEWEEFTFDIYFAPGQTEYHSVISSQIDGRKVAFTGDNIFYQDVLVGLKIESRPYQTTVLRNSFQLDMHRQCIEVMRKISPELICPGHVEIIKCDKSVLDSYADFIISKERAFRNLVTDPADQYIDLFWVRMLPYVSEVEPSEELDYTLLVRNNFAQRTTYEARLIAPDGWITSHEYVSITLDAKSRGELKLNVKAPSGNGRCRQLVTAELRIDGVSQGPIAEALVTVI